MRFYPAGNVTVNQEIERLSKRIETTRRAMNAAPQQAQKDRPQAIRYVTENDDNAAPTPQ